MSYGNFRPTIPAIWFLDPSRYAQKILRCPQLRSPTTVILTYRIFAGFQCATTHNQGCIDARAESSFVLARRESSKGIGRVEKPAYPLCLSDGISVPVREFNQRCATKRRTTCCHRRGAATQAAACPPWLWQLHLSRLAPRSPELG